MKYLTEEIGDTYKAWTAKKPVVIHAPTGSGKTFFILNRLLPYVAECGKRMVYLSNRSALKQQVENEFQRDSALAKYQGSITICNYQRLSSVNIRNGNERPYGLSADQKERWREDHEIIHSDYYVLDEAHYFLADSDFNMELKECVKRIESIQSQNSSAIWVYMTATLPYLLLYLSSDITAFPSLQNSIKPQCPPYLQTPDLYEYENYFNSAKALLTYKEQKDLKCHYFDKEIEFWEKFKIWPEPKTPNPVIDMSRNLDIARVAKRYFQHRYEQYDRFFEKVKDQLNYYFIEPQPFRFIPIYYSIDEELLVAIRHSPPEDKWLIFVKSKTIGKSMQKALVKAGYPDTIFIDSGSKYRKKTTPEKKVWNQIAQEEKFSQKILITTKVLDNGVNIKDTNLRHIVIQDLEQTTFLQMLGRKRFLNENETERVFVYLRNISEGTICKHFQQHIQNIMLFWYHLFKIQSRTDLNKGLLTEIQMFQSHYMEGGHYRAPYRNYVIEKDISSITFDRAGSFFPKDNPGILVDLYQPDEYFSLKLTYQYYKILSMLERARDERLHVLLKEKCTTEECEIREIELQRRQFVWLKEQLSWLGISTDGEDWETNPINPKNLEHWIGIYFHLIDRAKEELFQFLNSHVGVLSEAEADDLKTLYHQFLVVAVPGSPAVKLKGSVKKIQEFFVEYDFPYRLYSKKHSRNGKQRNWWHIERADDSSQETSN